MWLTDCVESVQSDQNALDWLKKAAEEESLDKKIVIENGVNSQPACEDLKPEISDIQETSSRSLSQEITFTGKDKDRYLFIADTWYPGWKASVDGIDTTIYRADYVFRAVKVPAGAISIRLEYMPTSFVLGLLLTLAGIIFCVILGFWRTSPSGG